MASSECVVVLDFGGQYNQLIARRVRECNVYCEVKPYTTPLSELKKMSPVGIIFTGGPGSVYLEEAPKADPEIYSLGVPILGICYGCQLIASQMGGSVIPADEKTAREYGRTETWFDTDSPLFQGLPEQGITWMSHSDVTDRLPEGFIAEAHTEQCPTVAIACRKKKIYGVQFHPEVNHTQNGLEMIRNFLYNVCGVKGDWSMDDFCRESIERLRKQIGPDGRVLLALSGGVDSSVLAALLAEAIGNRLTCVFVDHGLMRKNEADEIQAAFDRWDIRFERIEAEQRFLDKLAGVTDPQEKRRIIGAEFGYVFNEAADWFQISDNDFLAQGTIYPDVIESGQGDASTIKSHHNRLLPQETIDRFRGVLEPLSLLFKDEVRELGRQLGLPDYQVDRQPFPGPGLAIRILGEVTKEKCDILREADYIMRQELALAGEDKNLSQYFCVLTNCRSVGVMGDDRTYDYTLALRAVTTFDFMTADWARIPYDILDKISGRIVNEVEGINRIVYDITSKPPATVEWE